MKRSIKLTAMCIIVLAANAACGSGLAPRELLDARDAYNKAKSGAASQHSLAELETAKQSLQEAEAAFRDGDEESTKNLAYIAERKAQLAEAAGNLEQANKERLAAIQQREDAQADYRKRTQKELTAAQRQLEETKRKSQDAAAQLDAERARRLAAEKKAAAALASLEQLAKVKEDQRGVVITLSGAVLFATGKHELLPIAREKLNEVAKALEDQGYKSLIVEGHTDSRGGDSSNLALSERRANAVRTHLISQGIDANKISAIGMGETKPVASNDTSEGRANNRRVEIVVKPE